MEKDELTESGKLISFNYLYGTFRYRPFEFTIERVIADDGVERIYFTAEGYDNGLISVNEEIEEAVLDDIVAIMKDENIFAWDGFDQSNTEVRDGFSFSLRAKFENRTVRANGYMKAPDNFKEGHQRLSEYLLSLAKNYTIDL